MPSGKNRLYIALYARGGQPKMSTLEDTYHWALIIGPKKESEHGRGWRFHAKQGVKSDGTMGWLFEEVQIRLIATQMLLVRICIGKIEDDERTKTILRGVPIRDTVEGWNCVYWVAEALRLLKADGKAVGTGELDWTKVRNSAMAYVQQKKVQHRFDGKGPFDTSRPATYDFMEGKETIP